MNTSPSTTINLKTPQEVWSSTPSDCYGLRIFGCPTYAHVNDGKLEPKAMKCIFLGYATGVKGYRLWCTKKGRTPKFIISRDVAFDESAMFGQKEELDNLVGNKDHGAHQKVEFEIKGPKRMTTNPEEQPREVKDS